MKKVLMIVAGFGVFGICTTAALSAQSQAWSHVISGTARFLPLIQFNNEAVLDKETGLVWQQAPLEGQWPWGSAQFYCAHLTVANRRGWRVPTVQELESLIDPERWEHES